MNAPTPTTTATPTLQERAAAARQELRDAIEAWRIAESTDWHASRRMFTAAENLLEALGDTDRHREVRQPEQVTCPVCKGFSTDGILVCRYCRNTGTVPAHPEAAQDVQQGQTTVEHRIGRLVMDAVEAAILAARGEE